MKIQCTVCETAEATVLCCADEAALCDRCDETVHAANKLASKHQRFSLTHSTSHLPICDICQEAVGYFFCLEDRALLCRKCDIAIHTVNSLVSAHQRFLLTGVKVGLEAAEPGSSSSGARTTPSWDKGSDADNHTEPRRCAPTPTTTRYDRAASGQNGAEAVAHCNNRSMPMSVSEYAEIQPVQNGTLEDLTQSRMSFAGGSVAGNLSHWPVDEYLEMSDFHQNFNFTVNGSSKVFPGVPFYCFLCSSALVTELKLKRSWTKTCMRRVYAYSLKFYLCHVDKCCDFRGPGLVRQPQTATRASFWAARPGPSFGEPGPAQPLEGLGPGQGQRVPSIDGLHAAGGQV
ncbi:hypothetical protein RND81_12G238400 [Saponaria officinalis]|uniref:B box-type domain-containing protein n=1 Tax=Saponaria officinalis TaxID=3572 RepID=A0AAW1HET3_SAPOF